MTKQLGRRIGRTAVHVVRRRLQTDRERAIEEWKAGDWARRLLDYDLDAESVVVDVGGYRGQWASDVFARFCCTVHVYEPVREFAEDVRRRFAANSRIVVHDVGLGAETRDATIRLDDVGSSLHAADGGSAQRVRVVRAADALRDAGLEAIDLMQVNIEGGEYELLPHLSESGWLPRIRHLQIQFHETGRGSDETSRVREMLAETHDLSWRKELVWESWGRRGG